MALTIVHVLTRLLKAGSEENTLATCRAQLAQGHRVIIVHGKEFDEDIRAIAKDASSEVIRLAELVHPISPIHDFRAVRAMAKLFRSSGVDVVHTHQSKAGILGRLAARRASVKTIIHGVHILPFENVGKIKAVIYIAAERWCARFTDAFINVSPSVRDACIERKIGTPKQHFVALSAMEVERFKAPVPPVDAGALLGLAGDQARPPTVVMLAAFEPRKGHLSFIAALPNAFNCLPDWRVLFAGRGETEEAAQRLVAELGLQHRVRFAGYRTDPEAIIALGDVCVLTSIREGLPRVIVQYAAAGKAIVVSDIPGITDVVRNGKSAIITQAGDIPAAAHASAALLADPAMRERLSAGAKAVDVDAWSVENMNETIQQVYKSIGAV